MAISEKELEQQLVCLPIKEKLDAGEMQRLVRSLNDGEVKPVTLEKKIIPVHEVNRYVIVEHIIGNPSTKGGAHTHTELSTHVLFENAQAEFRKKVFNYTDDVPLGNGLKELLLVGKFGSGDLAYDKNGTLDKTSGITLDFAVTFPGRSYSLTSGCDPYKPITLQEKVFALLDTKTESIQLLDLSLNRIALNEFWKTVEGPSINGVKIPPKSDDEIELMSKQRTNQSNGLKK